MGPSASELRIIPLFHDFGQEELVQVGLCKRGDIDHELFEVGEPGLYLSISGEAVLDPGSGSRRRGC